MVTGRPLLTLVRVADAWPLGVEEWRREGGGSTARTRGLETWLEEGWVLFWAGAAKPKEITVQQRGAQGVRQRAGLPTLSLPVSPSYWHVLRGP